MGKKDKVDDDVIAEESSSSDQVDDDEEPEEEGEAGPSKGNTNVEITSKGNTNVEITDVGVEVNLPDDGASQLETRNELDQNPLLRQLPFTMEVD